MYGSQEKYILFQRTQFEPFGRFIYMELVLSFGEPAAVFQYHFFVIYSPFPANFVSLWDETEAFEMNILIDNNMSANGPNIVLENYKNMEAKNKESFLGFETCLHTFL